MNKFLFLDLDGVCNSQEWFQTQYIVLGRSVKTLHEKLDPVAVNRINRITDATNAKIVLSSTWRMGFQGDVAKLSDFMKSVGFTGEVVGMTPVLNHFRGGEISNWLINNDLAGAAKFIIIDDSNDMGTLMSKLIRTDLLVGIQDEHVKLAIEMLNE
jgi:hypothetical protein